MKSKKLTPDQHFELSENLGLAGSALLSELLEVQTPEYFTTGRLDFDFDFAHFTERVGSFPDLNAVQKRMILNVLRELQGDHLQLRAHLAGKSKIEILDEIYRIKNPKTQNKMGAAEAKKVAITVFAGAVGVLVSDREFYLKFSIYPQKRKKSKGFFGSRREGENHFLAGRCFYVFDPDPGEDIFSNRYFLDIKNVFQHEYFHFLYANYLKKYEFPVGQKSTVLENVLKISDKVEEKTKLEKCYFHDPELQSLFWEFRNELCAYSISDQIRIDENALQTSIDFDARIRETSSAERIIFLHQWRALKLVLIECQDKKINPRILLPHFLASQSFDEMRVKIEKVLGWS